MRIGSRFQVEILSHGVSILELGLNSDRTMIGIRDIFNKLAIYEFLPEISESNQATSLKDTEEIVKPLYEFSQVSSFCFDLALFNMLSYSSG